MACQKPQFVDDHSVNGACFGELSDAYVATRSGRPEVILEKLSEYIIKGPVGPVLDAATGTGISAREVADWNPGVSVVGVDHDPLMLEKAIKAEEVAAEVIASKRKPISYLRGEVEALPIADQTIGMVTAMACFHWFNKDEALQEFFRVLKPGGHVAIVSGSGRYQALVQEALKPVVGYKIEHPAMGEEDPDLFHRHGFDIVYTKWYHHSQRMTIAAAVERVSSSSYWSKVKEANKEALAAEALTAAFTKLQDGDKMFTRENDRLLTILKKR